MWPANITSCNNCYTQASLTWSIHVNYCHPGSFFVKNIQTWFLLLTVLCVPARVYCVVGAYQKTEAANSTAWVRWRGLYLASDDTRSRRLQAATRPATTQLATSSWWQSFIHFYRMNSCRSLLLSIDMCLLSASCVRRQNLTALTMS